jgi:hypothetical protein
LINGRLVCKPRLGKAKQASSGPARGKNDYDYVLDYAHVNVDVDVVVHVLVVGSCG